MTTHRCRAAILFCMDLRLHDHLHSFMSDQGLDEDGTDVIRVAGAVKNLVRPVHERDREFVLDQLRTAHRIHHVCQLYVVNHEDCGAYGPEDIPDTAEELAVHREDLLAAQELLQREFEAVEVIPYFMWLSGQTEQIQ